LTSSESISRNSGANTKDEQEKVFLFSSSVPVEDGKNITLELDVENKREFKRKAQEEKCKKSNKERGTRSIMRYNNNNEV